MLVIYSEHAEHEIHRLVDRVVVEHGTLPNAELYNELLAGPTNRGEVDYRALLGLKPQGVTRNPAGSYQLFRIGDAVNSRSIHSAVFDALRLCLPA